MSICPRVSKGSCDVAVRIDSTSVRAEEMAGNSERGSVSDSLSSSRFLYYFSIIINFTLQLDMYYKFSSLN